MYLAIDGGKKGGAALFTNKGELADTYQFSIPSVPRIPSEMREFGQWVVPRVHTIIAEAPPDYRTIGAIQHKNTQMLCYGYQIGTAVARCTPKNEIVLVPARTWKAYFQLNKGKDASLDLARQFHPDLADTALKFKKNDGVAEAILIGHYYIETNL